MKLQTLPNLGYIIEDIPTGIFDNIKRECEINEKKEYVLTDNDTMISALTDVGVSKHFWLSDDNYNLLSGYLLDLAERYNKEYNYISSFTTLTHNVPFKCNRPWVNIQKKGEYLPNHKHSGFLSYVIWVKIPYYIQDETRPMKYYSEITPEWNDGGYTAKFCFSYANILGVIQNELLPLDRNYEGKIMIFPSLLQHCVYPFYSTDDNRVSISGNLMFDTSLYGRNNAT